MKIMINIDQGIAEEIVLYGRIPKDYENTVIDALRNGIPLPEHHGKLKDVDELYEKSRLCHTEEDGTACVEWREINDAPTIIEADKENEE